MPMIKFDVSGQDPDESTAAPEPPPPGLYKAKIAAAVAGYKAGEDGKPDKSAPRVEVTYEVIESADDKNPNVKGGRVWDYVTFYDSTKRRLDQFLQAVGLATKTKRTGQFDPEKLVGKIVKIRVTAKRDRDEYAPNLAGVWKWDGAGGAKGGDDGLSDAKPAAKAAGSTKKAAAKAAEPEEEDLVELGRAADEDGDDEAAGRLSELAEAAGEDPDSYDTWSALAEVLAGGEGEGGGEAEGGDEEGPTLEALGEAGDADDTEAQERLTELAEANELDPNDFETWAELATALEEAGVDPNADAEDPF